MRKERWRRALHVLSLGLRLRCPACGCGRLFSRGIHMRPTCPYCHVRFERSYGESLGAVYLNTGATLGLALIGFFSVDAAFSPPVLDQLVLWGGFSLVFPMLSFRAARGLWVSIAYLTGGVYADPDYERDYIAPRRPALHGLSKHRD